MQTHPSKIILRPRVTEKSTLVSEIDNAVVFEVSKEATKTSIKKAFIELYKVTPKKVTIVKLPAKKIMFKGKAGKTNAIKKAHIFLAKGDKIDLM